MLLASVSVPRSSVATRHSRVRERALPRRESRAQAKSPVDPIPFLVAWVAIGMVVVFCVPVTRGGVALGATVPFWLIAAPLIDIIWLKRHRLIETLRASRARGWKT